ncbi:MAG: nicotinate phosphoribosyltransferase [Nitriliruptorales bacterium]|nr:nicotinate phosphoribosyltransferase [Nitriliruptorales bacterium]
MSRPASTGLGARTATGLLTDHYELTMIAGALQAGIADHRAIFETFARILPGGRRYGVFAGLGRLADALARFRFDPEELAWLSDRNIMDDATLDWLASYRFRGTVTAYPEGDLYFPHSPVVRVEGGFAESVVLETIVLSHLNFDSAIASAAARMVTAAKGRRLLEFGSRRTHEEAAIAAARAAYLVGFDSTSNLEAGRRYGIPTSGTSAHAFTLAFPDEPAAFRAQLKTLGTSTTLLVDTFDVGKGVRNAVEAAGGGLGAVRIDSGELREETLRARAQLDELRAPGAKIVLSGDLDEYRIAELGDAPADALGIGTRLVTGSGAPTGEFVYKLVAVADRPGADAPLRSVAKAGGVKSTVGGRKRAWRERDLTGTAIAEVVTTEDAEPPANARDLQTPVMIDGVLLDLPSLDEMRAAHEAAKAELPEVAHRLDEGPPAIPTRRRHDQ